jgi:hypothetical protein
MPRTYGTIDGQPAKIVYHPARRQTHIYWGGHGKPDGYGHNHAVVQDANPDAVHFLRENGRIVVNHNARSHQERRQQEAAMSIGRLLVDSTRKALRFYRWSYNLGRRR